MKKRTWAFLATVAAAGVYGAIKGSGPFNTLRFREVHEKVTSYMNWKYPTAVYTPISKTQKGWVTTITRFDQPKIILYITCDNDGNYIFSENIVNEK